MECGGVARKREVDVRGEVCSFLKEASRRRERRRVRRSMSVRVVALPRMSKCEMPGGRVFVNVV